MSDPVFAVGDYRFMEEENVITDECKVNRN